MSSLNLDPSDYLELITRQGNDVDILFEVEDEETGTPEDFTTYNNIDLEVRDKRTDVLLFKLSLDNGITPANGSFSVNISGADYTYAKGDYDFDIKCVNAQNETYYPVWGDWRINKRITR